MNDDMRVEYTLNQLVNYLAEQNEIRLNELNRYPVCIFYGQFSENLKQMIQMEIVSRIGNEDAVEIICVGHDREIEAQISNTINSYRRKMENGSLRMLDQYYVPFIYMADQLNADEAKEFLRKFHAQMHRMGFGGNYKIWYYCIFNYEHMDGISCKEQIMKLQQDEKCNFPLGIYTQNNLFATEYQQYLKSVQSIAMHIFLNISHTDESLWVPSGNEKHALGFVMGYWKLDILRQQVADYLIHSINRQEENLIESANYPIQIRRTIDRIVSWDEDEWLSRFDKMPVNYAAIKKYMHSKIFSLKRPTLTYGEVLVLLYGREDAFSEFVESNIDKDREGIDTEKFFNSDIGNIYAVTRVLKDTLAIIKQQYQAEHEEVSAAGSNYDAGFHFERNDTVENILSRLKSYFWNKEIKVLEIKRKILFTDKLIECMASQEFQETVKTIREKNRSEINRLTLIRREFTLSEGRSIGIAGLKGLMPAEEKIPSWKEDIIKDIQMQKIPADVLQVKYQVQEWMSRHAKEVLGTFVNGLQVLKMNSQSELYYSARIDNLREGAEKEFLYMGIQKQNNPADMEEYQNLARLMLPRVQMFSRNWESNMCFELFVIRAIESLDEIYNMNEGQMEGTHDKECVSILCE